MTYLAPKIWVSVDCLVFGYDTNASELKVLLFKREVEPFLGEWSLIGGFVEEEENLENAAVRILDNFTGLSNVFLEQLQVFGNVNRDPAGRVVSVLYWSLIKIHDLKKDKAKIHGARWFSLSELPDLILDHKEMVNLGRQELITDAKLKPIGFELLPQEFTLPQLKQLYDTIYGGSVDDRNFRKQILKTELLIKLDKKDKSSSRKGAFLYKFDSEKYKQLSKEGYHLDLKI
ncbi:NUDIX domain-containing protein [Marinoscillum sp. MHG1-6]|uniref:NUDIX hydrolase n=1 Tax=Marinoscillum sp. MHG1-6 TaxID=2959627 RepID=UPI00215766B7|nr:NUDIX domain-containing protein [Marinoscillum sp. MHG1-6]